MFLDLESLGALSIEGHPDTARRLRRSAAETVDLLVAEAASTFVARAQGVARDGLVATVMVAADGNDPVLVGRLAEAATPGGRGIAIVTLDPLEPDVPHVVANDDGTVDIPHLGLTVLAAELGTDELGRVDDLLGHEPDTAGDVIAEPVIVAVDPAQPYEAPAWSYCVRVLDHLLVEDVDGTALLFRYGANLSWPHLATLRDKGEGSSREQIADSGAHGRGAGRPVALRARRSCCAGTNPLR